MNNSVAFSGSQMCAAHHGMYKQSQSQIKLTRYHQVLFDKSEQIQILQLFFRILFYFLKKGF